MKNKSFPKELFEDKIAILAPTTCGSDDSLRSGCYCPKSWEHVVERLLVEIEEYSVKHNLNLRVNQIKEKFGSLRVYTTHDHITDVYDLINKAAEEIDLVSEIHES